MQGLPSTEPLPSDPRLEQRLVARYLDILEVPRRRPGLGALSELVRAHLLRIPFENLSKIYYAKRLQAATLPDLDRYLEDVHRFRLGGTCYANNYFLHRLLVSLGYDAALCGADMAEPDVHVVNLVKVEGQDFLVDAGYAAPFLEPLPLGLEPDHTVASGDDRYVLGPRDARGRSRLERFRKGVLKHGYDLNPKPRRIHEFQSIIADSYRPQATFMNALLMARFFDHGSVLIHNLAVVESHGLTSCTQVLPDQAALAEAIHRHFAIPRDFIMETLAELDLGQDPWG